MMFTSKPLFLWDFPASHVLLPERIDSYSVDIPLLLTHHNPIIMPSLSHHYPIIIPLSSPDYPIIIPSLSHHYPIIIPHYPIIITLLSKYTLFAAMFFFSKRPSSHCCQWIRQDCSFGAAGKAILARAVCHLAPWHRRNSGGWNPLWKQHVQWLLNHWLQCEAPKIAKLVYNSNNYGLWYANNWGASHLGGCD